MATQKPISTISYNSEAFLKEKLDSWVNAHIIQAYQYIKHKGEDGDKDHIHVRIEPNKKLDPMDLQDQLREYTLDNNKPLRVRPFRPSKEEDWILYAVHDEDYLKLKYGGGENGEKLPYKWQDIKCPDNYDMEVAFIRAKSYLEHSTVNMATRMKQGEDPISLILQGENPYTVNAIMRALCVNDYQRLQKDYNDMSARAYKAESLLEALQKAIKEYGLVVLCDDDGEPYLEPYNPKDLAQQERINRNG